MDRLQTRMRREALITLRDASVLFEASYRLAVIRCRSFNLRCRERSRRPPLNSALGTQLGLKRALPVPAEALQDETSRHQKNERATNSEYSSRILTSPFKARTPIGHSAQ